MKVQWCTWMFNNSNGVFGCSIMQVSADQRSRLLRTTEGQNQTTDRIRDSHRTMLETEELGVSILHDLHQQRQSLLHAHDTVSNYLFNSPCLNQLVCSCVSFILSQNIVSSSVMQCVCNLLKGNPVEIINQVSLYLKCVFRYSLLTNKYVCVQVCIYTCMY